ncbi:hypothetical protein [Pseudomonas syringae]|nr:hypothetical protein [Pseudomonas syringae]
MESNKMDLFNEVSLRILSALYASFPAPIGLNPAVIGMLEDTSYQNELGAMVHEEEWKNLDQFIKDTARWLANEGYLSHRQDHSRFWSTYTLSSMGLKCLKNVEQPNIGQSTFAEKLKDEGATAAKAAASKFMDQFLAAGATILINAAGLSS